MSIKAAAFFPRPPLSAEISLSDPSNDTLSRRFTRHRLWSYRRPPPRHRRSPRSQIAVEETVGPSFSSQSSPSHPMCTPLSSTLDGRCQSQAAPPLTAASRYCTSPSADPTAMHPPLQAAPPDCALPISWLRNHSAAAPVTAVKSSPPSKQQQLPIFSFNGIYQFCYPSGNLSWVLSLMVEMLGYEEEK